MAAAGRVNRRGNFAGNRVKHLAACTHPGHAVEQGARVRVSRGCIELGHRCNFDDPPQVHDGHPIAHVANHAKVVADEDGGQAQVAPQVHKQVQNLCLDRDIQRGHRLVQHQQVGLHGQGTGDGHTLPLAARELVREAPAQVRVQPHTLQHAGHVGVGLPRLYQLMREWPFTDGVAHPHARVEAGEGVLMNHLHPGCQLDGAPTLLPGHWRAVKHHLALTRAVDAGHDAPQGGLATT